jgi:hypothetical protein
MSVPVTKHDTDSIGFQILLSFIFISSLILFCSFALKLKLQDNEKKLETLQDTVYRIESSVKK